MDERKILFVCLHGSAKSVIAASHFQRLADARGLKVHAAFAGIEPDREIAPRVVKELLGEGFDVRAQRPLLVTREDLMGAWRVISFGCDLESVAPGVRVERWDEVPAVSEGYKAARDVIVGRLPSLLDEFGRAHRNAPERKT